MKLLGKISILAAACLSVVSLASCDDNKSYSDRLNEETRAINSYLADQRVIGAVPEDSVFEVGPTAPYYRLDGDGYVYMRVVNAGDKDDRVKYNDPVYIRFMRYNLFDYKDGELGSGDGNSEDVTYDELFRYDNYSSASSIAWGMGIQEPLKFLGYGCEVQLVIRSQRGRSEEIANVQPYLYNVRYFKSRI